MSDNSNINNTDNASDLNPVQIPKKNISDIRNIHVKEYDNHDKEVMIKKISRLQKDEHLVIRRIIKRNKPDIKMKKVNGGSYMYFHNLDNIVYHEIDKYLDELSKKNNEELRKYISETDYNSTEDNADADSITQARLRLSNRERHMLNRQRFDKIRSEEIKESIDMNIRGVNANTNTDANTDANTNIFEKKNKTISVGIADFSSVFDTFGQNTKTNTIVKNNKANKNKINKINKK
jgi:hypothetical protein